MLSSSFVSSICFFLCVILGALCFGASEPLVFTIRADQEASLHEVVRLAPADPFRVGAVSLEVDTATNKDELRYLFGVTQGAMSSGELVAQGVRCLMKKKKFDQAVLALVKHAEDERVDVHCALSSVWTMGRLKMHGMAIGKDAYRRLYTMDPGDVFDEYKHRHALTLIKQELMHEGYYDPTITDWLEYDQDYKSVTAHIALAKGASFSLAALECRVVPSAELGAAEQELLRTLFAAFIDEHTSAKLCTKQLLNDKARALKRALQQRGFMQHEIRMTQHIDHEHSAITLSFDVEVHHKREFFFDANHVFSSEQLRDTLLALGYAVPYLPASIFQQELQKKYHAAGFWHAQIDYKEEADAIYFTLDEGVRSAVVMIEVRDAEREVPDLVIKKIFRPLLKHDAFDQLYADQGMQALLAWYQEQGLRDARVVSCEYRLLHAHEYAMIIHMHAGQKASVPMQGALPALEPLPPPMVFGKTIIQGNRRVPFHVIMRELCYQSGDIWDERLLNQSCDNIRKLDVFESFYWYPHDSGRSRDVLLKVVEDDPFELRLRAGLALQRFIYNYHLQGLTYKVGGSFLMKNPTQAGDSFRIDVDMLRTNRICLAQYIRPWLFDRPLTMRLQGYNNSYWQPGLCDDKRSLYRVTQQGALLGLKRSYLGTGVELGVSGGFERINTTVRTQGICSEGSVLKVARAIYFDPQLLNVPVSYVLFEPTCLINRVDNLLEPHHGWFCLMSLKGMWSCKKGIQGSFLKLLCDQSFFIPYHRCVCALRMRVGHIFNTNFQAVMPIERFYLGGANSIRSYETDMCPPLGIIEHESGGVECVPRGGNTMVQCSIEIRFPVHDRIGGVFFQDLGALRDDCAAKSINQDFVAATGFGIRCASPLGPLRFDMGWKWHRTTAKPICDQRSYAWFLTFGHAF